MTDVKLPPLPKGKYQWWDDYYTGISLSEEPEDRYHQLGLYDEDQVREYARLAVLQERERCAKVCEELTASGFSATNSELIMWRCATQDCADAIRKGE